MGNPLKGMIMGYLMPVSTAAAVMFIPEYDQGYLKWIVAVFVVLLLLPIVLLYRFSANRGKAYKLTMTYQIYACIFFSIFPLLKVLEGRLVIQMLVVGLFISAYFLARVDQRTEVPIVFPDSDKTKWLAIPFYALPVLLVILGPSSNYIVTRRFFETHENDFIMSYISTLIYLFACWLLFFLSSIFYKSHVKEGYLEK